MSESEAMYVDALHVKITALEAVVAHLEYLLARKESPNA